MNGLGSRVILAGHTSGDVLVAAVYEYRAATVDEWNLSTSNSTEHTKYVIVGKNNGTHDPDAKYWIRIGGHISDEGEGKDLNHVLGLNWYKNWTKPSAVTMDATGDTIAIGFASHKDGANEVGMVRTYRHNGSTSFSSV